MRLLYSHFTSAHWYRHGVGVDATGKAKSKMSAHFQSISELVVRPRERSWGLWNDHDHRTILKYLDWRSVKECNSFSKISEPFHTHRLHSEINKTSLICLTCLLQSAIEFCKISTYKKNYMITFLIFNK